MMLESQNGRVLIDFSQIYVSVQITSGTIMAVRLDGKGIVLGQYSTTENVYYVIEMLKNSYREGDRVFTFPKDDDI